MKKLVVTILVSLVLSGCAKNKSQNDFIINSTEEEKETEVTLDDNDEYQLKNIEMGKKEEKDICNRLIKMLGKCKQKDLVIMHDQKQNQVQNNLVHKHKKQVVAVKKRAE